jgi:hypothetical protein
VGKTLTIRLAGSQDAALTRRARLLGKTRSELVRELIDRGLETPPAGGRIGHLRGRLALGVAKTGWQRSLKRRNWR